MSFGLYQTFRLIFYESYNVWMTNSSVFENTFWDSHYNLNVCLSVHIFDIFFLLNLSPLYDVLHHIFTESSSSGYDNDQHKDIKKTKTQKNVSKTQCPPNFRKAGGSRISNLCVWYDVLMTNSRVFYMSQSKIIP